MARCGCSSSNCACVLEDGANTTVTGDGSAATPYQVNVASTGTFLEIDDSSTIDLALAGDGTAGNPYVISASVIPQVSYETPQAADFTHAVVAAAGVYEKITELADLDIVEAGVYLVHFEARTVAVIPGGTAAVNTGNTIALHKNNALVANSETRGSLVSQGAATTTEPALQVQGTATGFALVTCAAGDDLSMYVKRTTSTAGTSNSVISDAEGRAKITAVRIRP